MKMEIMSIRITMELLLNKKDYNMGYYVKGFGSSPLILQVSKTNHSDIIEGLTPRQAILNCIDCCQKQLNDWTGHTSPHARRITKDMTKALIQLNQLLKIYP